MIPWAHRTFLHVVIIWFMVMLVDEVDHVVSMLQLFGLWSCWRMRLIWAATNL
jgi:hypothetical protein